MKIDEIKKYYISNQKLFFASIELTQNCNFKCKHCYCIDKKCNNLSLKDYKNIIDKLYETSCIFLNFTGGEIFTYKYFSEIYTYAKNKGFIIDLLTNASLINNDLINLFRKLPPNNIAVTLYGTNEEDYDNFTGSGDNYFKVLTSLQLLRENSIPFVLRTVGAKTLKKSLFNGSFEQVAKKFHTTFKYDPVIFPKINGDNEPLNECMKEREIVELENKNTAKKIAWKKFICDTKNKSFHWTCNAGINSMAIDYKGDVFVCGLYRNRPISILDNSIENVLIHLRKIHEEHVQIVKNNQCSRCDKRTICKWCPAYSLIYNHNDFEKIDFFCNLSQIRMKCFGE